MDRSQFEDANTTGTAEWRVNVVFADFEHNQKLLLFPLDFLAKMEAGTPSEFVSDANV